MGSIVTKVFDWIASDGVYHILFSLIITILFSPILPIWGSALATLGVGVLKELCDFLIKKTVFSFHDIVCDLIGIFVGVLLLLYIRVVSL